MTGRTAAAIASALLGLGLVTGVTGCTNFYEIPIETPIQAKLDVSPFQRVHVVGFIAGGSDDVDANLETVRLLRSQLRTRSGLRVIEADVLPLAEIAQGMAPAAGDGPEKPADKTPEKTSESGTNGHTGSAPGTGAPGTGAPGTGAPGTGAPGTGAHGTGAADQDPAKDAQTGGPRIRDEKDLASFEQIFANVEYWKKLGEEFQQPLIVTGTVLFTPQSKQGVVAQTREGYDQFGRRVSSVQRVYMERKGYILRPKFIFIDGRTGARLYSETFREERLYPSSQNVPALSSYFELMDDVIPRFLNVLSTQKVRGTRVLLK
jgi:hypothetical protein